MHWNMMYLIIKSPSIFLYLPFAPFNLFIRLGRNSALILPEFLPLFKRGRSRLCRHGTRCKRCLFRSTLLTEAPQSGIGIKSQRSKPHFGLWRGVRCNVGQRPHHAHDWTP